MTEALERAFREERAAVLATLIRQVGDFDLAEEALQDAFTAAASAWRDGVPDNPAAWLTVAARRRAIDRVRRSKARAARAEALAALPRTEATPDDVFGDDRLRLIFTCCHPALNVDARVALTLRALGGLTTGEIARAFLVEEPTMGKRIVRAKRKIADAHIPYAVPAPADLPARVSAVLAVLYLIFNEGYEASSGERLARADLCEEAIRLSRLLCLLLPGDAEARGLLALMLLTDARRPARVDAHGDTSRSSSRTARAGTASGSPKASPRSPTRCGSARPAATSCRRRSPPPTCARTGATSPRSTARWPRSSRRPSWRSTARPPSGWRARRRTACWCSRRCCASPSCAATSRCTRLTRSCCGARATTAARRTRTAARSR